MVPDAMNVLGIISVVLLGCLCVMLTFRAWWDSRANDSAALKQHLRIIGVSQFVIVATCIAIGADMVASCRIAIERSESQTIGRREFAGHQVFRASR